MTIAELKEVLADADYNSDPKAQDIGLYGMPLGTFNAYRALAAQCRKVLEASFDGALERTHTFTDWANQSITYRVRAAKPSEVGEAGTWPVCEINPHGDAWQAFGRAKTAAEAVKEAIASWNEYDRSRD